MVLAAVRDEVREDAVDGTRPTPLPDPEWTAPSWDDVVRTHSARVYRLAYRLTGNQHDAEDLTQEVFVRVFRSLASYTPGTFEGWLHRITTNLFLDLARRRHCCEVLKLWRFLGCGLCLHRSSSVQHRQKNILWVAQTGIQNVFG